MGTVTVSLPADGSTGTVGQYNTPLTTVVNEFNGNIDNANIKSAAAIATSKLADDNGIGAAKLSNSAICLGYAQITSNFTSTSATAVQITGLTATVTIPPGSRRIKVTGYVLTHGSTGISQLSVWDGTVGSGTQLNATNSPSALSVGAEVVAVVTPAAGSKTYNIGVLTTSGTTTVGAGATTPAFILVEAI